MDADHAVGDRSRNGPVPSVFIKDKWNQEKLQEVKDAENIASDPIVKAAKVTTMHNPDVFMVANGW